MVWRIDFRDYYREADNDARTLMLPPRHTTPLEGSVHVSIILPAPLLWNKSKPSEIVLSLLGSL